jgi:hypothetical protein
VCVFTGSAGTASATVAEGFAVNAARTYLVNDVYVVDADIDYRFSEDVAEALDNGIPLIVALEIEIRRPQDHFWNARIVGIRHDFRIEHHALTDQYLVIDLITGTRRSFSTLEETRHGFGQVRQIPVVDRGRLHAGERYRGLLRARIEIEELPAPLRLVAYFSSSWYLSTGWYKWDFDA